MGTRTNTACSDKLEPGDEFVCEHCSQSSQAVLNDSILECMICLVRIQGYDLVDHDRVQLDEGGRMSGRGAPVRLGQRPSRTVIGNSRGKAGNGRSWNYLGRVDRGGNDGRPTPRKQDAIDLVWRHARTKAHRACSLELLDIGWPDRDRTSRSPLAVECPIWRAAHPHGMGSSAAACLHIAAEEMGFDSRFGYWAELCLPGVGSKESKSFGFRSLKRMRVILGDLGRTRSSAGESAGAIMQRANLGETIYGGLGARIEEAWLVCTLAGDNLEGHARGVLAAICHIMAEDGGLPVRPGLIQKRFDVGRSYQNWIERVRNLIH